MKTREGVDEAVVDLPRRHKRDRSWSCSAQTRVAEGRCPLVEIAGKRAHVFGSHSAHSAGRGQLTEVRYHFHGRMTGMSTRVRMQSAQPVQPIADIAGPGGSSLTATATRRIPATAQIQRMVLDSL